MENNARNAYHFYSTDDAMYNLLLSIHKQQLNEQAAIECINEGLYNIKQEELDANTIVSDWWHDNENDCYIIQVIAFNYSIDYWGCGSCEYDQVSIQATINFNEATVSINGIQAIETE